jgi:hypothetical protein
VLQPDPDRPRQIQSSSDRVLAQNSSESIDSLDLHEATRRSVKYFGERHLEGVLVEFVDHYNEARPHRGIDLEVPAPYTSKTLFDDTSRITRVDRLGGLVREYSIAA